MISLNLERAVQQAELEKYKETVKKIHQAIHDKTGRGSDYLGWVNWPNDYDLAEFVQVKKLAQEIRANAEVLLVCGIGGSYLGSRSAIEWLNGLYSNERLKIIFVGNTFSANYLNQVIE